MEFQEQETGETHLCVDLSPRDVDRLERSATLLGRTRQAAAIHALELLDMIVDHVGQGGAVKLHHLDGTVTRLLVRFPEKGLQGGDNGKIRDKI